MLQAVVRMVTISYILFCTVFIIVACTEQTFDKYLLIYLDIVPITFKTPLA